mmetsp:Transcript_23175/g.45613  ORF Transcript_23175/g.45613 Transcript_23175/m.45613 type:complete len:209 (-) Transcript_23175:1257-1883(-)
MFSSSFCSCTSSFSTFFSASLASFLSWSTSLCLAEIMSFSSWNFFSASSRVPATSCTFAWRFSISFRLLFTSSLSVSCEAFRSEISLSVAWTSTSFFSRSCTAFSIFFSSSSFFFAFFSRSFRAFSSILSASLVTSFFLSLMASMTLCASLFCSTASRSCASIPDRCSFILLMSSLLSATLFPSSSFSVPIIMRVDSSSPHRSRNFRC